ncbi:flagellar assembly protein FliH [Oceanobacillus alkalisoli]|uniref:flagellar assembly protein FliH n=1 Tax=Oceanobacillus alkalisoli TaxID=2925113 RepID=UPI001EEFFD8F|nr:flagellar assembly protein FliH [Oceanobacillus alkalisoli]MCF3942434.1 flagellar assembly protein FliH [Oceanobacillus alkalisoli]MCG5103491.1 flagellar assembly protein FliH [Oceanobacillus alkalisoli]
MMNSNELPRREIKIKPIEYIKKQTPEKQQEETVESVLVNVGQAKEELKQLEQQKAAMLANVQDEINRARENWKEEKAALMESAQEAGYEAGFQTGREASMKVYAAEIAEANRIVELVKMDYQKTLEQTEDVIIDIAIHTAEKILGEKLNEAPEKFLKIVRLALKEISDQSVVSIYLHPANYETVLMQKSELKRMLEKDTKLSLYINDELQEGSCLIEHPFGQIDASVDTQLEAIRNALKELVMEHES